jgi:hypothetical protein
MGASARVSGWLPARSLGGEVAVWGCLTLNGSYSASTNGKLHHEKWFCKIVSRTTVCADAMPLSTQGLNRSCGIGAPINR